MTTSLSRTETRVLNGLGVSSGVAVGPAAIVGAAPQVPAGEPASADPDADWSRVATAIEQTAADLESRAAAASKLAADVLTATAMMARDPSLAKSIRRGLAGGRGPATAVQAAVDEACATLAALGGYMAERVTDLRDVGTRIVARLLGLPQPGVPSVDVPSVLVARDLAPADTVGLSPETTLAIVTELGGPTSHTAILAAQLGIPAVAHATGALDIAAGTVLAVDGAAGTVTIAPDSGLDAVYREKSARRAARLAARSGAGVTADGHAVSLLANIGTVADAVAAGGADLQGVGLFRTEFLFLDRRTAPSREEQAAAYTEVLAPFAGRPVVVRTLDAGADKPLPFAELGEEENPALGVRGLRLSRRKPELLDDQLAALADARDRTGADVRVMAPMVSTASEARWFAASVHAHGLPMAGVMVEVPAAALRARQVVGEVEFVSIGTNDLAQYTFAADRLQGDLADLLDAWQPALLDLVAATASAGSELGRPVGVCGEAAGDPLLALVLTGLGVTSLSMAPVKVAAVRYALSEHTIEDCRRIAAAARQAWSASDAREAAQALVSADVRDIL